MFFTILINAVNMKKEIILFVLCISILTSCINISSDRDWPTFRGDVAYSGHFRGAGLSKLKKLKWEFETESNIYTAPVIENGVVFLRSNDKLLTIDLQTGEAKQKISTNYIIKTNPAVIGGVVFLEGTIIIFTL